MTQELTLDKLTHAIKSNAAAFRRVVELQPVGGPGSKVFPPTYEGGKYATEKRRINGDTVNCVQLDSVQSQANRMEAALQEAVDAELLKLPIISVDFTGTNAPFVGKITSLQAPHRIADAILRDSLLGNTPFRQSSIGKLLDTVSVRDVTSLFQYCPTALVFGIWDSSGARGGLGAKFGRAVVSEIIGINAVPGQRTSSRIDPLQIALKAGPVYQSNEDIWTLDASIAIRDNNQPKLFGKKGKPSEINHGNVTPSFAFQKEREQILKDKDGNSIPIGGFTIDCAQQITTLSLPALRRLKFGAANIEATTAAHTALAALGLCAATLASEQGYDLRSQCALYTSEPLTWELLDAPGEAPKSFTLDGKAARGLLNEAQSAAAKVGLPMKLTPVTLIPQDKLVTLVVRSYAAGVDEDNQDAAE